MILLIVSIFFYLFPGTLKGFPLLPPEISLSFVSEIEIIKGAFLEKVKNLIFGTGPTTFILDYSRFRSPLLNQTVFWGTRFSRGHSAFFDWVLTKGVFGGLSLIFLYLLTVFIFVKNLKKENLFDLKLGLSASLFSAIYISFFYPLNFTLWFLFWFLLGTFWFFFSEEEMRFKITTPSQTIFSNFIFMVSIILAFILIFFNARSYLAENNYFKATIASGKGETEQSINYLTQAIKFNYLVDTYWRDLSQMFLTQATQISQDPNIPLEEKRARINLALSKGGEAINQAIRLGPMNVANWNVRGFFYQNLIGIKEAENLALASYRTAIQLEPVSPYSFGEIGRVYILIAQNLDKEGKTEEKISNLNSAIESLNKAIALKPDYAPAHYLSAVALDQLGKLDEAILKLEQTAIIAPRDIGVRFQLGMLYWRKGEIEKAQSQFEQIINLTPDYSNARYMLGLIFDKKGEKEKAKSEFETVAKLNPENQEVKKILENLEKGLPALEGIVSTQPTVKELPPEIKK
jgi:tetratricopeptide (TPR) repeat protein